MAAPHVVQAVLCWQLGVRWRALTDALGGGNDHSQHKRWTLCLRSDDQ